MADKVKGWLRKKQAGDGMAWLWCYQKLRPGDGEMVENSIPLAWSLKSGTTRPPLG